MGGRGARLARATRALLAVQIALHVLSTAAGITLTALHRSGTEGGVWNDVGVGLWWAVRLEMLATAVVFFAWLHDAVRATHERLPGALDVKPGSAVIVWFVPLANLFAPYDVIRRLDAANGGAPTSLILAWWVAFWARALVNAAAGALGGQPSIAARVGYGVVSLGTSALAAWLCARVISRIERLQAGHGRSIEELARVFS